MSPDEYGFPTIRELEEEVSDLYSRAELAARRGEDAYSESLGRRAEFLSRYVPRYRFGIFGADSDAFGND
jgi:hypothetical protein